jgi:formiminoglutamase
MTTLYHDPNWPRAGAWLRGASVKKTVAKLGIVGAPSHRGSITPGRCDLAPAAIRSALDRYSTYDIEHDRDVREIAVDDHGDVDVTELSVEDAFAPIHVGVGKALGGTDAVVVLGGDNSITRPGVRALEGCGLLTFDAHLDLRDLDNGLNNGNPVRALLADGMPGSRIIQIGIQPFANSDIYADVARKAGITVVTVDQVRARGIAQIVEEALATFKTDTIYVDLDLDVLDRAFAAACPGSRPGGLMPWEIRIAARICGLDPRVRVMDLVEIDPIHDLENQTALAAAACLLSFASGLHERCSR